MIHRNQFPAHAMGATTTLDHAVNSFEQIEQRLESLSSEDGSDVATREEFLETMKQAQSVNWTIRGALSQRYGMLNKVLDEMK